MPRPKRAILLVHSYYLRDTRARRHGAALADDGWEVDVVCARDRGEPRRERVGSVRIRRLPTRRRGGSPARRIFEYAAFALMGLLAVTALWLRRRHRLVYVLGMPNLIVFCAIVPRLARARVLLDMRDPFPEFFLAKYEASDRHPLMRVLLLEERLSARFASAVLTVGPSLEKLFARSISTKRITVVYNGADPKLFRPRDTSRREPSDRTLLYVGTVTYPYGVDLAVQAVARLRDRIPGVRMRIVGDGDLLVRIREIAGTEGITDRLQLDRQVPLDRVPDILDEVWLGVQPNRPSLLMTHSLSTKILEWCRVGLPVVAGRTGPLVDIFRDGEILFHEPGDLDGLCDRILEAHADDEALTARAERAHEALDRIRFEDQIETFLRIAEGT
jgi:glycosyltransferase involved in cell wall biosynthesis